MDKQARTTAFLAPDGARLDETDLQILQHLEADARISNQDLATLVDLSPSATLHRVRRMEQMRVIRGYRADIDPEVFAPWVLVHAEVALTAPGRQEMDRVHERIQAMPEILEAWGLLEKYDLGLKLALPSVSESQAFKATFDMEGRWVLRWRCQQVLRVLKPRAPHPALSQCANALLSPDTQNT